MALKRVATGPVPPLLTLTSLLIAISAPGGRYVARCFFGLGINPRSHRQTAVTTISAQRTPPLTFFGGLEVLLHNSLWLFASPLLPLLLNSSLRGTVSLLTHPNLPLPLSFHGLPGTRVRNCFRGLPAHYATSNSTANLIALAMATRTTRGTPPVRPVARQWPVRSVVVSRRLSLSIVAS
ncbi:hypothetical protein C8Q78DRAFT_801865 [Trametes maxima]|nr:hypothetical protein C8Q78DRAFT_801865 [Trametes maxima]